LGCGFGGAAAADRRNVAYANPESQEIANQGGGQFAIALAGPLANLATALALTAAILGASAQVRLFDLPLVDAAPDQKHGVDAVLPGVLHFLPAYPLDFDG